MASQNVPLSLSAAAGAQSRSTSLNSVEKEQQCVLHWFRGWSPFQRQDFFSFLLDRAVPHKMDSLFEAMGTLDMRDKPPSIFQCQLKLLREWFADWTDKERNDLVMQLAAVDPDFVHRFNQEVSKAGMT